MKIKLYIFLLFLSVSVFAQQKQVQTSIDTTRNKIGAQFNLTIKTEVDTSATVVFPRGNYFGGMEVIRSYVVDTVKKDGRYELIKKYGLTQFDSGKYGIPPLKVLINKKEYLTDPILVEVSNVVVDTLKQKMYDIKPIAEAESDNSWIWKLILALLLLGGIGAFAYWWFKIRKTEEKEEEIVFKSPIEKATILLNSLENKQLWQRGEIKSYYSELTDIARNYIEEAIEIPAMESTSTELIQGLRIASMKKKMTLSQETIENLERVLQTADLVKFAKSKPLDFEITEDRKKIEKAIITLDKAIPVVVEEEIDELLLNEMQRQEQLRIQQKKQRNKQITIGVASVLGIITLVTSVFIYAKGLDFVIDTVFGNDSKELLEGEWIKSEYGNPPVIIETPQVLERMDPEKVLPKNTMALIKEMQLFAYGSFTDNFYVFVSTSKFKNDTEIDLSKALEGFVKVMEMQGGMNIIVKEESFKSPDGIEGIKGYGTMSILDSNKKESHRVYYETAFFKHEGGLQQIMILHKESDGYAEQITDRILKSVEFKKEITNE
ncbi:MAG: hypothetical protein ACI7YS_01675 [Flavobacterium sp.]